MRIAMREFLRMEQRPELAQFFNDRIVGREDILTGPFAAFSSEYAAGIDWCKRLQTVLRADHKILVAMAGRGMHQAGAGVSGNVIREHQLAVAGDERVAEDVAAIERL